MPETSYTFGEERDGLVTVRVSRGDLTRTYRVPTEDGETMNPVEQAITPDVEAIVARARQEERERVVTLCVTLERLERLGVITTDPADAQECCGIPRDEDGRCIHRPGHPIYVGRESHDGPRFVSFDDDCDW